MPRPPRSSDPPFDVLFYMPWIGSLLRPGVALPTGGAETQVLLVSRELAARGHRVGLVAFDLPGGLPTEVDGVHVLSRPPYRAQRKLVGKFVEMSWIWRSLHRNPAAVVVKRAAGSDVGLVGLFARLLGQRFVFSTANVVDFTFSTLMPKRRDLLLYHFGVRLAEHVVVQTDEQKLLCERHFHRTAVTIRSIAEPAPGNGDGDAPPTEPEAFLWAGRIVDYKQPLAYVELARSMPHARFVMVGVATPHGEPGAQLVAQVLDAAAGVPNLELVDPLPRDELARLIARAVAIVNTADFEGMSNVALEGWVRGIPSLALTHDPDGVIERHGLGGFAAGEPERLRHLAESLWRRDGRAEMEARCRRYVAVHHASEVVAAQWETALGLPRTARAPLVAISPTGATPCVE